MKIKEYIKSLGFSWTDISIIPFFAITILLVLEDVNLMWAEGIGNFSKPLWLFIIYFVIGLLSLLSFLFFEYKKGLKAPYTALAVLGIIIVFNIFAIYSNPSTISLTLFNVDYSTFSLAVSITNDINFIHLISFLYYLTSAFLWIFIFPKKFKNFNFLSLLYYTLHLITIFVLIYSFFADDYITYFTKLIGGIEGFEYIKDYIPRSIFGNPNVYAFYLEIGIIFTLFHHSYRPRKSDYILLIIYYVLLIFTICKAGILITSSLLVSYLIFLYIESFKKKSTTSIIAISIIFLVFIEVFLLILKSYYSSAIIKEKIDFFLGGIGSFTGRKEIWNIAYQLIQHNIFYGFGHGIYTTLLYEGVAEIYEQGFISSHNSFLTILGEGGIVYLLAYASLIVYAFFLAIKMIKKNLNLSLALIFGLLLFLIHSCLEDIYYYTELIVVFIAISYNVYKHQNDEVKELPVNKEAQA